MYLFALALVTSREHDNISVLNDLLHYLTEIAMLHNKAT